MDGQTNKSSKVLNNNASSGSCIWKRWLVVIHKVECRQVLKEMQLFSVSQLFETNDNMTTSEEEKVELFEHLDQHHPSLSNKLKWIRRNLRDTRLTRTHAYPTSFTTGQAQIQQDSKLSIKYRKQSRQDLDASIGTAPAYATRQRDRKKTTLKGKADSLVRKNDTQRKLKNASRIKAVAIRKIKLPHSKNGRH